MQLSSSALQKLAIVQAGAAALALTVVRTHRSSTPETEISVEAPRLTPTNEPTPGAGPSPFFRLEAQSPEILPSTEPVDAYQPAVFRFPGAQIYTVPFPRPSIAKEKCGFCGMG